VAWGPSGKRLWKKTGNGDVQAIAYGFGQIIAGGHFTEFDNRNIRRLVSLNPATGRLNTSWTPNPDLGGVLGIRFGGDKLFVGGSFRVVGDTLIRRFAQFSVDPGLAADAFTEEIESK
jgi:hypothetical protein